MEVELKLLLDPQDNELLLQHPLLGAPARVQQLTAHYFDTPDLHLLRHGAGLRVRTVDGEWVQTMKAGGSVQSGLHSRNEWEGVIDRAWPRLGKLRKLIGDDVHWLAILAAPDLKDRLESLFVVDVQRHVWDVESGGNRIEVALDVGHIERQSRKVRVNEVELELKDGDPAGLYAFALQLLEDIPVRISNINKAQRGYMLVRETAHAPYHAQALQLDADASLREALPAVLGNCLEHIQRNEVAVIEGHDPETLHQMRVGVRRLRSALKLFASVAPCPPALQQDIDWLGTELGAARDWDVLLSSTLARVTATSGGQLQTLALETVHAKRRQAAQALLSPRYTHLMLTLGSWILQVAPLLNGSAVQFSRQIMQQLHKSLLKRANRMDQDDPSSAHRTRIAAKRARYALEFFHTLYRKRTARAYLKALAATQEELGQHNDLAVADRLLRALAQDHPEADGEIQFARGYLVAQQTAQPADLDAIRSRLHTLRLPHIKH
ncbi:Inorganic triphosphatase YgiF, contains CYTH and CHAD domains [Duganella sacchari]|uniref:Inorganic triphosphatase YgiF, contains CYTH and CHAD domains n=1 Tax=Duganella sacchari TaxID=551987 RepID=A0A1M7PFH0_9BURK|nr:CHAD domain-containing protein [Duganella sacchari]SHN15777.1 Inorganic triphosphatase YgiF, contains CYTH and CHAD domains [Duganella sacchari]